MPSPSRKGVARNIFRGGAILPSLPPLPLPFLSLPVPPLPFPPLPLEVGPLNPARGSGGRSKLPQWGLGRSPSRQTIWCISGPKGAALVATVLWIFVGINLIFGDYYMIFSTKIT